MAYRKQLEEPESVAIARLHEEAETKRRQLQIRSDERVARLQVLKEWYATGDTPAACLFVLCVGVVLFAIVAALMVLHHYLWAR